MALLHEIVGTIVASAALTLAIYVFIRSLDYQSYKDTDIIDRRRPHVRKMISGA